MGSRNPPRINLLKLHGSIDWMIDQNDNVQERESTFSLYGEKFKGRLMIYPIHEKFVSQEPYFSLYSCFKSMLSVSQVCIAIGYSFRDQSVNNAFLDVFKNDASKKLYVVNMNTAPIKERLKSAPANNVTYINATFGAPEFISTLTQNMMNS